MSLGGQAEARIKNQKSKKIGMKKVQNQTAEGKKGGEGRNKTEMDNSKARRKEKAGSVAVGKYGGDNIYCHNCHNN